MNTYDALKVLGVSESPVTEEIVKTAYRQACLKFHPDRNPAGNEMMILINEAKKTLISVSYPFEYKNEDGDNYGEEINEALNKIKNLQGLKIEVWAFPPEYKQSFQKM
jgi:curved DNA-binding protein CbpA